MSKMRDKIRRMAATRRVRAPILRAAARISGAAIIVAGAGTAILFLAGSPSGTSAQPARIMSGAGDDMRAVYANTDDIAQGKKIAETSCAGCHGLNGVSTVEEVPNLAAQRPAYLYAEMRAYQNGARSNEAMGAAVKNLNDDALTKAAAYYASLDPAPGSASGGAAPAEPDPVEAGKAASAACAGCHGDTGVSRTPGMPSLAGNDPKYLVAAMAAYKSGGRKNQLMNAVLAKLGDADLDNIALFYALQKPGRAQTPAPGDPAEGKTAAAGCAGCHGEEGVSANAAFPSLAGQDAQYLAATLQAYKDATRKDATMKGFAAPLDSDGMKNLAAYYASLEPQAPNIRKPLTVSEWAQRCDRCHGVNGNSTDPRLPALAGQRVDYLQKVLRAYRTGDRKSPQMAAMSDILTEQDVDTLAAHYGRQTARAFVYVILPRK